MTDAFYPSMAFSFSLAIDGEEAEAGGFSEVSGLGTEVTVAEVVEGGENRFVHKLPGQASPPNLVLKRGMLIAGTPLIQWLQDTMDGGLTQPVTPKDITLTLMNAAQQPVMQWQFARAWPVKWSGGNLDATKGEVVVEQVEFAYASVTRDI